MYIATLTSILAFFIIFSAGFFDIVFALKDSHGALERIIASKASQLAGRLPESGDKPVQKKAEPFSLESVCGTIMDTGSGAFLFGKEARKKWPILSGSPGFWLRFRIGENEPPVRVPPRMWNIMARP